MKPPSALSRLFKATTASLLVAAAPAAAEISGAWFPTMPVANVSLLPASSTRPAPSPEFVARAANWMARLPDNRFLGAVSLPGTHNSAARFGVYLCQNQSWSLDDQLAAGVRYLDIRLRRYGDGFAVHHGPCFQNLGFDGVVEAVGGFLARHPSEAVVMRVREEYGPPAGSAAFRDIWARYMRLYGGRFLPAMDHVPTLGEARGRILVLRDADMAGQGIAYNGPLLKIQDAWQVFVGDNDNPYGPDTVSVQQKYRMIRKSMAAAAELNPRGEFLYLNHLSSPGLSGPMDFAARTNQYVFDAITAAPATRPIGIPIMDYPGEGLIEKIIQTNFAPR